MAWPRRQAMQAYQLPLLLLALTGASALTGALAAGAAAASAERRGAKEAVQALQDRRVLLGDLKFSHKELAAHRRRLAVAGVDGPQLARFFLTYLKNNVPAYSNYARVMERTGFNNTLGTILSMFPVTVLVPRNDVLSLSASTAKYIEQRLGFLILAGRWGQKSIKTALPGVKFPTCGCYPKVGAIPLYKLKGKKPLLGGKPQDSTGATILMPSFVSHPSGILLAHGISKFITPYRFFG